MTKKEHKKERMPIAGVVKRCLFVLAALMYPFGTISCERVCGLDDAMLYL
jgi:ABC-type Co2+ transport system permease subunit